MPNMNTIIRRDYYRRKVEKAENDLLDTIEVHEIASEPILQEIEYYQEKLENIVND